MFDQLIIGDKKSYDDFGASLSKRKIGMPTKKEISETVPYSNITYDFSGINGEVYWNDRELEYTFEMTADTPERLEDLKIAFASWIMNVFEEELHDPFIADYHFKATYKDLSFDDEEGLNKTTATAKFKAYPYKIANIPTAYVFELPANATTTMVIENHSSHRVTAAISLSGEDPEGIISGNWADNFGAYKIEFEYSRHSYGRVNIPVGALTLEATNTGTTGSVEISFVEEVF